MTKHKEGSVESNEIHRGTDIAVLKEGQAGAIVAEFCRRYGMSDASYYNRKAKYDGMTVSDGVKLNFIRPGKPIESAYAESFIGRLRDECLNENRFISLKDARDTIESWRIGYNDGRPHSSLRGFIPGQYVENTGTTLIAVGL